MTYHTLTWGQSLALGTLGTPPISTVSETPNAWLVASDGTTTNPLRSTIQQQTQLSLGYRLSAVRALDKHVFSTHASGSTKIADLSKGGASGRYEQAIAYVTAAAGVPANSPYSVEAIHAVQGEADQQAGTSFDNYLLALTQLKNDFNSDIGAITTPHEIPLIASQTATWAHYGSPARIGLSQLEAARTVSGVYLVGGQYQLPYVSDGLHLTNVGYYRLGELHARAHESVVTGAGWKPFAPVQYTVTAGYIDITYDSPSGALEFDTTTVPPQTHMGFSLSGSSAGISSVSIVEGNKVRLFTTQPVVENSATVGYGVAYQNGSVGLGNLCDTTQTTSVYDGSRLANWAVHSRDSINIVGPYGYDVSKMYLVGTGGRLYELEPSAQS